MDILNINGIKITSGIEAPKVHAWTVGDICYNTGGGSVLYWRCVVSGTSGIWESIKKVATLESLNQKISSEPTQAEVQVISNKLDELLQLMKESNQMKT